MQEVFIDYVGPAHAGPGPHPSEESSAFKLTQGGIRWFSDGTVKYKFTGTEDVTGGNSAIEAAEATLEAFITTRAFERNDGSPTFNPCRDADGDGQQDAGEDNEVRWAAIDGAGDILATASVCRNVATKEIAGFVLTFDTDEDWSIGGSETTFDVQNVATHEFGHVAGLGHVNAPKDGCLTAYRFADEGETQKRSLGLGDKLGLSALYANVPDTDAGSCGS